MTNPKRCLLFFLGGGGYVLLELLWRGRSHSSMFLAGGLCALLVGHLNEVTPRLPLPLRLLAGAGIITAVELAIGLLANRNYHIWDYRDMPGNFLGMICPGFCCLWVPISWVALKLHDWVEQNFSFSV